MKTATRSEAEKGLGALLDIVEKGETVLIVDGDRPIARLEPPSASKVDDEERIARLERAGILRRGHGGPVESVLRGERVKPRDGADIVQILIEERGR